MGGSCRGNKINYAVSGSGKPLILVHGFGMFLLKLESFLAKFSSNMDFCSLI